MLYLFNKVASASVKNYGETKPLVAFWATTEWRPYKTSLLLIISFVFISCSGCSDTQSQLSTDRDSDLSTVEDDSTDCDSDLSTVDTDLLFTDSDVDTQPPCEPPLMEAPFPYYDKEGNMTFCRPGCDTPTEKDPQCMSNLWKEQNQALCTQKPEYACCGLPCVKEDFSPVPWHRLVG